MTKKEFHYENICEEIENKGYYLAIGKSLQPTFDVENPYIEEDGEATKEVKIKSLFMSNDSSSPLKMVDTNDVCWDVDDYLNEDDMKRLNKVVIFATA